MKTKSLLRKVMMMAVLTLVSTFFAGSGSAEASSAAQNGVNYGQAVSYLQNCSHQHTVNSIQVIPGTNSYRANVDNGVVATVNVSNGSITGHSDEQATIIVHDQNG